MLLFHKKALVARTVILVTVTVVGVILVLNLSGLLINEAKAETKESICKTSVFLRETTHKDIMDPVTGEIKIGTVASPLLCSTIDLRLPKDKKATKEKIEKDVSELVVSCWNQFGGGTIKDPFKKGDSFINNCFICYTVNLGESSDFKRGKDEILSKELSDYMFNNEYKPKIPLFSCEKNNGKCWKENLDTENYVEKDEWKCPKEKDKDNKCFVKKTSVKTYLSHIQNAGGIVVIDDIKPSETYAIAFGSPTENCGWCETGQEVGAILAGGAILIGGVATGGALWLVAPAALVAAGGGALIGHSSGKIAASIKEIITERKTHTIYLTTLNRLNSENGELCSIVESQ